MAVILNMYYIHVAMYLLKESLFIVLQSSNYVVKPNKNDVYLRMCRISIVSWSPNIRGFGGAIFFWQHYAIHMCDAKFPTLSI